MMAMMAICSVRCTVQEGFNLKWSLSQGPIRLVACLVGLAVSTISFLGKLGLQSPTHATLSLWQDLCITPKSEDEAEDPNDMFARFFKDRDPS